MATTKEKLYQKRCEAEERKVNRMMERYSLKYGRNWTKYDLTAREHQAFLSALRKQKRAIGSLIDIEVKEGRLKKR